MGAATAAHHLLLRHARRQHHFDLDRRRWAEPLRRRPCRPPRRTITGSFATSAIAPMAAPKIAAVYTDDPERLAKSARLLPATTGSNVLLAEPYDPIAFERGRNLDRVRSVSVVQAAMDSLTDPGRMPTDGEALLAGCAAMKDAGATRDLRA